MQGWLAVPEVEPQRDVTVSLASQSFQDLGY
jgi:hypothetical protein